jgi:Domain of unknown function (DUF5753)
VNVPPGPPLAECAMAFAASSLASKMTSSAAGQPTRKALSAARTPVTVTRIESGQSAPRVADAARMLELYGVTGTRREMLITLAREARRRGWWQQYSVTPWFEVYVGLEEEASEIRSYEAEAIPGLLQTEGYARAIMHADVDVPPEEEVQRRIVVRMKRQERITGEDAPKMWVVLNEAALHRQVGGRETMREQLRHLAEVSRANRVVVQVLGYGAGAHPGKLKGRSDSSHLGFAAANQEVIRRVSVTTAVTRSAGVMSNA